MRLTTAPKVQSQSPGHAREVFETKSPAVDRTPRKDRSLSSEKEAEASSAPAPACVALDRGSGRPPVYSFLGALRDALVLGRDL